MAVYFITTFVILVSSIKYSENLEYWGSFKVLENEKPIKLDNIYTQVQLADLEGTLYTNSLSQLNNVIELRLLHNQIRNIEPGALCSAPDLKLLEIDWNGNKQPPTLTKDMFGNSCDNLQELHLKFDYNKPSQIDQNALENVPNLKILVIDSASLNPLEKNFLKLNSKALTKLVLSNVHISRIDSNIFEESTNLTDLEIIHNMGLTHLPTGLFNNTSKLKRLVLRDNAIKNLKWTEFEGLSSLEELDVTDNQIDHFDANLIARNMPKLKTLFLELNPLVCDPNKNFAEQLKAKFNRSVDVPIRYPYINFCEL